MQNTTEVRRVGAHRKQDKSAKQSIAFVALASGALATAGGATGLAAAQTATTPQIAPVAQTTVATNAAPAAAAQNNQAAPVAQGSPVAQAAAAVADTPQILTVTQNKPLFDLGSQLDAAMRFAKARIAADEAARTPLTAKPAEGTFTSGFGPRWGTFHQGIDIANAVGTPILAVADGTVIDSGPASGFGKWIRIKHDDGTITVYGHMSTLNVGVGERVSAGQKIAGMGNEGFSTGSHLHFEVHPYGGPAVDPVPWLAARGISV